MARFLVAAACFYGVLFGVEAHAQQSQVELTAPAVVVHVAQNGNASRPTFPAPGRYLFGQGPEADVVGQGYIVMETTGDRVYGALYYPNSSFDCFHGRIQGNELAMTIINSYTQETYPYSVALVSDTAVASNQLSGGLEPLNLEGFYAIDGISDNDLRMLGMCQGTATP